MNYNKPLPPLRINDLNERTFFNERDTENPELRDMFKALGIIESFGTGIGEAKRSMAENNSPELFFKLFEGGESITSVVIPVNEEYFNAKIGSNPKKSLWIEAESKEIKDKILNSGYSKTIKQNLLRIYEEVRNEVFGNSRIVQTINCSEVTATSYIKTPVLNNYVGYIAEDFQLSSMYTGVHLQVMHHLGDVSGSKQVSAEYSHMLDDFFSKKINGKATVL